MTETEDHAVCLEIGPDAFARLTFDQPGSRANTLSTAVWEQLAAACAELLPRTDLRGLIVQSAKPGIFIAGADLRELAALPAEHSEPTRALLRLGHGVLDALDRLPFPTVALIDGACLGGGLEVAMACDFRLAGSNPKVKLGLPEVKLGLIPGWGGTQRLPRLIGVAIATPLVCTGDMLTAERAKEFGLVHDVVPSERLPAAAIDLLSAELSARTWSDLRWHKHTPVPDDQSLPDVSPTIAVLPEDERTAAQAAWQVMFLGTALPLPEALLIETEAFIPLLASPEARGKIDAFLKR
jgi:enoyl-CoA hydratase/carnithine racemase